MSAARRTIPPDPQEDPVGDFSLRSLRSRFTACDPTDEDSRHQLAIWDEYDSVRIEASRWPTPEQVLVARQLVEAAQQLLAAVEASVTATSATTTPATTTGVR